MLPGNKKQGIETALLKITAKSIVRAGAGTLWTMLRI